MTTPCRLFRLFPMHVSLFHDLFLKGIRQYEYDSIERKNDEPLIFKIYLEPLAKDDYGHPCDVGIDMPQYFYSRDEGSQVIKSTKSAYIRTYDSKIGNLLAIFAPKWVVPRIITALTIVAKRHDATIEEIVSPIFFKLGEKEEELRYEFFEVRRFWKKDIPDIYIRGAGISGIRLQESPEYDKYINRMGGKLMSIVFKWSETTILLSSDGLIFTYTDFKNNQEASQFFRSIITKLERIELMDFFM